MYLKKSIKSIFGTKSPQTENCQEPSSLLVFNNIFTGLELEVEGYDGQIMISPQIWKLESDGSLKNHGVEFILKNPLKGLKLAQSVNYLCDRLNSLESEKRLITNLRTSLHVHLDVTNLKLSTVRGLVALYLCFEKILYKYCGLWREASVFCVPFYDTASGLIQMSKCLSTHPGSFGQNTFKYYGMNIGVLPKLGTIEFRMHPATTNPKQIIDWINILHRLRQSSIKYSNTGEINDIPSILSDEGPINFMKNIFKSQFKLLKYNENELEEDVLDGVRVCQDFLYADLLGG